jgi:hypothetical protein
MQTPKQESTAMTEQEWLQCQQVGRAWSAVRKRDSRRRHRLFLVACCRQVWHIMTDRRCRHAVRVAELYADDAALVDELNAARAAVRVRNWRTATTGLLAWSVAEETPSYDVCRIAVRIALRHTRQEGDEAARAELEAQQMSLLRDIYGNPFQPLPVIKEAWLVWNDSLIPRLALAIYQEHAFERLPILADALEEAGCTDNMLLEHLRGPGPHARGCFALDLVLNLW